MIGCLACLALVDGGPAASSRAGPRLLVPCVACAVRLRGNAELRRCHGLAARRRQDAARGVAADIRSKAVPVLGL